MDLAAAIGTGNVGLLLDAWHLYTGGGSIDDLDKITAKDVVVVHVNDAPRAWRWKIRSIMCVGCLWKPVSLTCPAL